jgi:hypothetical protein
MQRHTLLLFRKPCAFLRHSGIKLRLRLRGLRGLYGRGRYGRSLCLPLFFGYQIIIESRLLSFDPVPILGHAPLGFVYIPKRI